MNDQKMNTQIHHSKGTMGVLCNQDRMAHGLPALIRDTCKSSSIRWNEVSWSVWSDEVTCETCRRVRAEGR